MQKGRHAALSYAEILFRIKVCMSQIFLFLLLYQQPLIYLTFHKTGLQKSVKIYSD